MADEHVRAGRRPVVKQGTVDRAPGGADLDERKAAILNAVVTEHIETAQPVGSGHITGLPGVEVSSATVRSEMSALERDGYLVQPHTSAGHVPTDKGYRFFVDHLARPGVLGPSQRQQVRKFYADMHLEMEELLEQTSRLLTGLTDYAAVVVGPAHGQAPVRSVQLVGLDARLALAVVVLADGAVEKRTIELPTDATDDAIGRASAHLTACMAGATLSHLPAAPATDLPDVDALVRAGRQALLELAGTEDGDHVFVGGSSRMADAFDAVDTVRSVLSILEQQLVVVELIEEVLDSGLSVAIGAEHGFEPLASSALVVAPLAFEGEHGTGAIGVLGPHRMNYPKTMAVVKVVGEQLGARLRTGAGKDWSRGD